MPESLRHNRGELNRYIQHFKAPENAKVDYRNLVEDLNRFDYERAMFGESSLEQPVPRSYATVRTEVTESVQLNEPRGIFDDDYIVLDRKKVPQNTMENIEKRTMNINRRLRKIFGRREDLDKKIREDITPDENGNVSVDQLRDFVLNVCETDLLSRRLIKRDVEGFLSAFNYNTYGSTSINDIPTLIFTTDDQIPIKLAERKRANPPPTEVNQDFEVKDVK